ncbi:MAG: hypothetical protein JWR24_2749 [Actinoallomurus sp.]|jgi:hypothetical protein|nr:hypothetical protein [Actinoallomurus sp.]
MRHDRTNDRMKLDIREQRRATEPMSARPRPAALTPRSARSARLIIALALVILAGFLLGLGVPIHP